MTMGGVLRVLFGVFISPLTTFAGLPNTRAGYLAPLIIALLETIFALAVGETWDVALLIGVFSVFYLFIATGIIDRNTRAGVPRGDYPRLLFALSLAHIPGFIADTLFQILHFTGPGADVLSEIITAVFAVMAVSRTRDLPFKRVLWPVLVGLGAAWFILSFVLKLLILGTLLAG